VCSQGHEGTPSTKIIGDAIQILITNAARGTADYATRAIACAQDLDVWASGVLRSDGSQER